MSEVVLQPASLFLPRVGEYTEQYLDQLSRPPERPLNNAEKAEVYEFERQLYQLAGYDDIRSTCTVDGWPLSLEKLQQLDATAAPVAAGYFLTDDSRTAARQAGLDDIATAADETTVEAALMNYSFSDPAKVTKAIIGKSTTWFNNQFAEGLVKGENPGPLKLTYFPHNPEHFAVYTRGLLAYSKLLRSLSARFRDESDNATSAKAAMVEIYQGRVNSLLAGKYPVLVTVYGQLSAAQQQQITRWLDADNSTRIQFLLNQQRQDMRFMRRLDAVRSGLSADIRETGLRTIGKAMLDFLNGSNAQKCEINDPVFSTEETRTLSTVTVNAGQLKVMLEKALQARGMLSREDYDIDTDRSRKRRATDGKWQVVIDPSVNSLAVDALPAVMRIPAELERSVTSVSPAGAIPVAGHELEHVEQAELSFVNNSLRIARGVRGKRALALNEAAGLRQERLSHARLFGQDRPYNRHYVAAMKVYEETGDRFKAMQAHLASREQSDPSSSDEERLKKAKKTVSAVRRIVERQGGFDSQALNYAEAALIEMALKGASNKVIEAVYGEGAFDLPDLVRLHRYGLSTSTHRTEKSLPGIFQGQAIDFLKNELQ